MAGVMGKLWVLTIEPVAKVSHSTFVPTRTPLRKKPSRGLKSARQAGSAAGG